MKKYTQQSRKKRKLSYIQLKNRMQGKSFFCYEDLVQGQWSDIYFFGPHKNIYNATIYTTRCAWHDLVESKAWDQLNALLDPEDKPFEIIELEGYKSNKLLSGPTTISNPPLNSLNGKTAMQFLDEAQVEIAQDTTLRVPEKFELLRDYTYGIGLDMVVHADRLGDEVINTAIAKFLSLGEKNWQSEATYHFVFESNFT